MYWGAGNILDFDLGGSYMGFMWKTHQAVHFKNVLLYLTM